MLAKLRAAWWRLLGGEPFRHVGATEHTPTPKADMAEAEHTPTTEPAPDFDVNVWTVDVHGALNALEDAFRADVEYIWGRFYDWLGVDARTRMELAGVGA
jgi:hypothetical protein